MNSYFKLLVTVALAAFGALQNSKGALFIEIVESGPNVVATISGAINDLYGTTFDSTVTLTNYNRIGGTPSAIYFSDNPGGTLSYDTYTGLIGPGNFSSAGIFAASSSTASASMVLSAAPVLYIPQSYILGTEITGQITWNSTTVAGLGLTNGFYFWDWSGDSITLHIDGSGPAPSPVPEPGQVAASLLLLAALTGYLVAKRINAPKRAFAAEIQAL